MNEPTQENRIRLVLLDEQELFRASLARLLASTPGLEVVGECGNPAAALAVLRASPVDLVLIDPGYVTDGDDGVVSAARRNGYQGRFLIIAETVDARMSARAIRLGASGIFLKSEAPDRLMQAIALVAQGAVWLDRKIVRLLADRSMDGFPPLDDRSSANGLTDRERKVLLGILGGLTNKRIGENLGLTEGAVKGSVQQLFSRTGVRTRSQLVRAVLEGALDTAKGVMKQLSASSNSGLQPSIPGNLSANRHPNG